MHSTTGPSQTQGNAQDHNHNHDHDRDDHPSCRPGQGIYTLRHTPGHHLLGTLPGLTRLAEQRKGKTCSRSPHASLRPSGLPVDCAHYPLPPLPLPWALSSYGLSLESPCLLVSLYTSTLPRFRRPFPPYIVLLVTLLTVLAGAPDKINPERNPRPFRASLSTSNC